MRRILIGLLVTAAVSVPRLAAAQNISTAQMQLVGSNTFTSRLQYLMTQQASLVLVEAQSDSVNADINARYTAPCHSLRLAYANQVLGGPASMASQASVLVSGANFAGGVIVGTATGTGLTADSSANDTALAKAITDSWNTLSKCFTNQ